MLFLVFGCQTDAHSISIDLPLALEGAFSARGGPRGLVASGPGRPARTRSDRSCHHLPSVPAQCRALSEASIDVLRRRSAIHAQDLQDMNMNLLDENLL